MCCVGLLAGLAHSTAEAQRRRRRVPVAQEQTDDDRARAHFETGASLYSQESYDGALAEFEASYQLRPVPVVLFNIAQTLRRLDRYPQAIELYEQYLRTADDVTPERRTAVRRVIADLRRAMAPVSIETDVPGVDIVVDGRSMGRTPLPGPVFLAAGQRRIEASRDGFLTVREEVRVVGGEAVSLRLRMPQEDSAGLLRVTASAADSMVTIDGVEVGPAPVERQLGRGGHSVEVEAAGFETFRHEVVLAPRQRRELFADLSPERSLVERWWFWTSLGVGVAVLGGVILALTLGGGQADPVPGTLGTVEALR